ncbi:MAG: hypothetical protein ACTHK3_09185 [Solirubrobacterales bacterium]
MKKIKMLGIGVLGAAAMAVLLVAGTASATVLCKNEACTEIYPVGTPIEAHLLSTSVFRTESSVVDECSESTIKGELENAGSTTTTPVGAVAGQTWNVCSGTTVTVKKGVIEFHVIIPPKPPITELEVTGKGGEVTITMAGVSCNYATGAGVKLGIYHYFPPSFQLNPKLKKSAGGFLCPAEVIWEAEYEVTKPSPVYFGE